MKRNSKASTHLLFTHHLPSQLKERVVNVSLVGCGGNGSQMLYKLARLDFALRELGREGLHVTVFDGDEVSRSNIGRQLFSPDDVGLNKAVVLVHRLNMSYGLAWVARPQNYLAPSESARHWGGVDVLLTCVDSAAARREIHAAMEAGMPGLNPAYWLDLGNTRDNGQVIIGEPRNREYIVAATLRPDEIFNVDPARRLALAEAQLEAKRLQTVVEVFPQLLDRRRKEDNSPSCSLAEALEKQSLFVNDQMSTWGAQLLDGLLREGKLDYHGVFVNLKTGAARPLACRERVLAPKIVLKKAA